MENKVRRRRVKEVIVSFVLICSLGSTEAKIDQIKIGAIFHEGDEMLEAAFDEAISTLDDEQNSFFNLKAIKKTKVEMESYKMVNVACELLQEGVAAIFGPKYPLTRDVVSSVAARFEIPHLEYSYRRRAERGERTKSINVYPGAMGFEKAIADIVRDMKWASYTYIYQTDTALSRIQETLKSRGRPDGAITVRELPPVSEIKALEEKERYNVYAGLIKELMGSSVSNFLIDVEHENLYTLIQIMSEMGLISDYFKGLIINLDSTTYDFEKFINAQTVANLTQFKFIRDESSKMSVEAALLYDSVFAFNDALTAVYKEASYQSSNDSDIQPKPLACDGADLAKYRAGLNITKTFFKRTKHGKKSGPMTFHDNGERDFEFHLVNKQGKASAQTGEWKDGHLILHQNEEQMNATISEAAKNKKFRVVVRQGPPYIMSANELSPDAKNINGKKYEGYCIDLIKKIEDFLNITCEFHLVPDNEYGFFDTTKKTWNGLIKQLLEYKADLAICDLTITSERQKAVDFTAPFMNLGISILFRKPEEVVPERFAFLSPLSTEVWIYMVTAYLLVSIMLFFQARMSPGEWLNPHPCNPDPDELENNFTLKNSMWLTMGSLMQQGSDILPRAPSTRVVTGMWWFFVLIIVSSYTANLAAFLTAVKMEDSINDVEDLAKQTKISYGAVIGGSTYSFFKNSNTSLYQRIFNTMFDTKPTVFTKNNDEGVERVRKGKRKYAFFMESTSIEYQMERNCELEQVGNLLDNKGYGIALPPDSPYRTFISTAILHLQEKGELQQLKQKWWTSKDKGGGKCTDENAEPANSNELGMAHVGGVFLVLMVGCLISVIIGIAEFLWNIRTVAIEEKITPKEALVNELKFIIDITASTKPVKTAKYSSKSASFQGNGFDKSNSVNASTPSSLNRLDLKVETNNSRDNEHELLDNVL